MLKAIVLIAVIFAAQAIEARPQDNKFFFNGFPNFQNNPFFSFFNQFRRTTTQRPATTLAPTAAPTPAPQNSRLFFANLPLGGTGYNLNVVPLGCIWFSSLCPSGFRATSTTAATTTAVTTAPPTSTTTA